MGLVARAVPVQRRIQLLVVAPVLVFVGRYDEHRTAVDAPSDDALDVTADRAGDDRCRAHASAGDDPAACASADEHRRRYALTLYGVGTDSVVSTVVGSVAVVAVVGAVVAVVGGAVVVG